MNTNNEAILNVNDLSVSFSGTKKSSGLFKAVDNISFFLNKGETLGIVGESGCGKTTLGKTIIGHYKPDAGSIYFKNNNIYDLSKNEFRKTRRQMQMIYQNPYSSLNPRMTVYDTLAEAVLCIGKYTRKNLIIETSSLLSLVGIDSQYMNKYPHEFSGGQRQRIAIARALALKPSLIIADEPVSSLDVSVQAQIMNVLLEIRDKLSLSMIFISHDLAIVKYIAHRVLVMKDGKAIECNDTKQLFSNPQQNYTRQLLDAVPDPDPDIT
jgi:oligopeptide transport system ATP-binding protein